MRPAPVKNRLQDIATRSFDLVIDEGLRNSVLNTIEVAEQAGWRLRAVQVPNVDALTCSKAEREKLFSRCITRELFDTGHALAQKPDPFTGPQELRAQLMEF